MATTSLPDVSGDGLLEDDSESKAAQLSTPNQEAFVAEVDKRYRRMKAGEAIERDLAEA